MELPKQFDNITSHVIDDLKVTLSSQFLHLCLRGITERVGESGRTALYLYLANV